MSALLGEPSEQVAISRSAAPLRQQVVDALRLSIVQGQLAPGARLVEREVIARLGVSRTVLRESLRQLESEGLIDVVPNKGAVVRTLTIAEARDIYAIRGVLEGLAARLFTEQADAEGLERLRDAFAATRAAYESGDPEAIAAQKTIFYDVLFRGAMSESLHAMINALQARVWRWRLLGLAHPQRSRRRGEESVAALGRLVAAVEARDGALAEAVAREEVTQASAEAIRLLREGEAASA